MGNYSNSLRIKFTQVPNNLINDSSISAKAKGIYLYLQSKTDEWQFYESEIANNFSDGRDSVRSGIKELIDAGYLLRIQRRAEGKFSHYDWVLNPTEDDLAEVGKSDIGKSNTNNTNSNNTNSKKENTKEKIDERFEAVWSAYPNKIGKAQAQKHWNKLSDDDKTLLETRALPAYVNSKKGSEKKHIKTGSNFLSSHWWKEWYEQQGEDLGPQPPATPWDTDDLLGGEGKLTERSRNELWRFSLKQAKRTGQTPEEVYLKLAEHNALHR